MEKIELRYRAPLKVVLRCLAATAWVGSGGAILVVAAIRGGSGRHGALAAVVPLGVVVGLYLLYKALAALLNRATMTFEGRHFRCASGPIWVGPAVTLPVADIVAFRGERGALLAQTVVLGRVKSRTWDSAVVALDRAGRSRRLTLGEISFEEAAALSTSLDGALKRARADACAPPSPACFLQEQLRWSERVSAGAVCCRVRPRHEGWRWGATAASFPVAVVMARDSGVVFGLMAGAIAAAGLAQEWAASGWREVTMDRARLVVRGGPAPWSRSLSTSLDTIEGFEHDLFAGETGEAPRPRVFARARAGQVIELPLRLRDEEAARYVAARLSEVLEGLRVPIHYRA